MTALASTSAMLRLLADWADAGWIRDLDYALARTLAERAEEDEPLVLLATALVSHQAGRGHLLLNLDHTLAEPDAILTAPQELAVRSHTQPSLAEVLRDVDGERWRAALRRSPLIQDPARTPLVLNGSNLYLRRFWEHERYIERSIQARILDRREHDPRRLRSLLDALFPKGQQPPDGQDWQKLACALAARQRFAVITGGPGTGKTTTVVKLLALLQALAFEQAEPLRLALAAPTGKAAARLNASIAGQIADLDLSRLPDAEALRAAIPAHVQTLHRLLGASGGERFRYHAERPLPLDAVVVDEASMIDEALMAALLAALPGHASLVLIGDKDQLASVEAGAVLSSLCGRAERGHYTPATRTWLAEVSGETLDDAYVDPRGSQLDQAVVMLRYSHRFAADSGIGRLARAVNAGDSAAALALLEDTTLEDVHLLPLEPGDDSRLLHLARNGFGAAPGILGFLDVLEDRRPPAAADAAANDLWAAEVLTAHARFQLLCAVHQGALGRVALNARIEAELARHGHIESGSGTRHAWYEGRPVIVTANDYDLDLRNGDVGITLRIDDPTSGEPALRVAFPQGDVSQGIRWVLPSRLSHCETVYAMTVHKAQGSEFEHVALVLPPQPSPVVTRELFYTALTRARRQVTVLTADPELIAAAVSRTVERSSALFRTRAQ